MRVGAAIHTAPQPAAPVEEEHQAACAAPRALGSQHVVGRAQPDRDLVRGRGRLRGGVGRGFGFGFGFGLVGSGEGGGVEGFESS